MEQFLLICLTFLVALAGSYVARLLKIPGGAMTGAVVAVAALNCLSGRAIVFSATKPCMQVLGGALLGRGISNQDLKKAGCICRAASILIVALIALNLCVGWGIFQLGGMNLSTALLATAPGGVSDMALIADDLQADVRIVSIMQMFRLFGIYLIFPPVIRFAQKRLKRSKKEYKPNQLVVEQEMKVSEKLQRGLVTLLVAFVGGYLFNLLGIPAGYMVGSVLACATLNICSGKGYLPGQWRPYIQSITGAVIGCQMTRDSLYLFRELMIPVLIMIIGMLGCTFLFGFLMERFSELDFQTSLLCLTPGGIQETSLLADELGCDTAAVVVMHTIRLIIVICVFPIFISFLV